MLVLDHTEAGWAKRCLRTNGALTYSKDLVKYQIPNWAEVLGPNDVISTCAKLSETSARGTFNIAIQYLHSYPYYGALDRIKYLVHHLPFKVKRLVFVTAYKEFQKELLDNGYEAIYTPMAIDADAIKEFNIGEKQDDGRIIYFGNIVHNKVNLFNKIKKEAMRAGFDLDYISMSKFNNISDINHEESLKLISTYKYGIAVGRCAQEMMALDVKVMIAGQRFGGLITNFMDYNKHLETNMNGRVCTYSNIPFKCLQNIRMSLIQPNNIKTVNHATLLNLTNYR